MFRSVRMRASTGNAVTHIETAMKIANGTRFVCFATSVPILPAFALPFAFAISLSRTSILSVTSLDWVLHGVTALPAVCSIATHLWSS